MGALTADKFRPDRRSTDHLASTCTSCLEDRERHVEVPAVHEQMYIKQKFRCAVCNCKVFLSQILIDSDPQTDETKGLVCRRCNKLLRLADRDLRVVKALVAYLAPAPTGASSPPLPVHNCT